MQLCDGWSLTGVHSDGGFAQSVAVPEDNLIGIPDALSWEQAAFSRPFANSIDAWAMAQVKPENRVGVIGAGGLDLGLVACAKVSSRTVAVADFSSARRDVASQLGASYVAPHLDGQFDVVFETFGSVDSRSHAVQLTKKGGKCVFMGFASQNLELNISEVIRDQKHLLGSFVYSGEHLRQAINLAEPCSSEWVTNVSFSEVEPLLRGYLSGDFSVVKGALRPDRA